MNPELRVQTVVTPDKRHLRVGIWNLPEGATPRGVCILLQGHAEFLEKYGEVADELRARGFIVVSMDWRGQGASERRGAINRAGHVGNFGEYDNDFGAVLLQIAEPLRRAGGGEPLPLFALAHSMGAHILLRFLSNHPRRFSCAVLTAPMLEIDTGKYSPLFVGALCFFFNLRRPSVRIVFGAEERDPLDLRFEDNLVTSDWGRFERTQGLIKAQPFLRIYGPTFGWLGATLSSMRRLKRASFAANLATPLLVFGAGHDRIVKTDAVREFAKRLPHGRYAELAEAEHEILMENDTIRAQFWSEFDAFVPANLSNPALFRLSS